MIIKNNSVYVSYSALRFMCQLRS